MAAEEERLYAQYFYNSVIEFIHFIFLYIKLYKVISLNNLSKYVKLFKIEVANLISSFDGKTLEDKLYHLLNTLDCFVLVDDKVKVKENIGFKNAFFEDLVLSKCVDLILKGLNNVDDICENLNYNSVIFISKKSLLHIFNKFSYISVNDKTVTLHHCHGLLGFEDHVHNSVISYFHGILSQCKLLSVNEIESHSKYLTICGKYNIMIIFSILNCSDQFIFQDGFILLNEKSKKYPKQRICVELMEAKYLPRSLDIGQIVYSNYGSFLHKWSGEIGNLTRSSGSIYCVVDFTNGYQGLFYISFSKASLKVISEMDSLEKYLNIRDAVEFDAKYYSGKRLDRCWRATRVKLLYNNKLQYDEVLCEKLNSQSKWHRNKCAKCYSNVNYAEHNYSFNVVDPEYYKRQLLEEKMNYKSGFLHDSLCKSGAVIKNIDEHTNGQVMSNNSHITTSDFLIPDYVFMFGYIHMLMEDKIVAVAKHGNEIYNILFMKDSVSPLNKSQNVFIKGKKIVACIPYVKKLDPFPVAVLVYGLSDQETNDTDKDDSAAEEFADKIFFQNTLCNKFCSHHNIQNGDYKKIEIFKSNLKIQMEVIELYNFIKSQYKISFQRDYLLQFLHVLSKTDSNGFNFSSKVFHFIVKFSKYLTKLNTHREHKLKYKGEFKNSVNFSSQAFIQLQELNILKESSSDKKLMHSSFGCRTKSLDSLTKKNNEMDLKISFESQSLDTMQKCLTSTSSLRTCSSYSTESFYSCESKCNSPKYSSNCSLDKPSSMISLHTKGVSNVTTMDAEFTQANTFPKILYEDTLLPIESRKNTKLQTKSFRNNLKNSKYHQYLSLHSTPLLKSCVRKQKVTMPCVSNHLCKNCAKSSYSSNSNAYTSMISESFFFLTTNLNGHDVVLPLARQNIPEKIQENMKLNSCCEINVITNTLVNLSHVLSVKIM